MLSTLMRSHYALSHRQDWATNPSCILTDWGSTEEAGEIWPHHDMDKERIFSRRQPEIPKHLMWKKRILPFTSRQICWALPCAATRQILNPSPTDFTNTRSETCLSWPTAEHLLRLFFLPTMKGRRPRSKVREASSLSSHGAVIEESRAEAVGVYIISYGCFTVEE